MIPILYDKYDLSDFTSTGYGALTECISCEVTEEVNGIYELTFQYPTTGRLFSRMANFGGVVACTHDHSGDVQLFDINKYDAPIDGVVTFYASHVSYRLRNFIYTGEQDLGPNPNIAEYFAYWNSGRYVMSFAEPHSFHFTDYSTFPETMRGEILGEAQCSIREALLDKEFDTQPIGTNAPQCFVQIWQGEFVFDRFNVNFYDKRGTNKGVQVRYGKNMKDVERTKDWGSTYSIIYAEWTLPDTVRRRYEFPVVSPYSETILSPWETITSQNPLIIEQMVTGANALELRPAQMNAIALDLSDVLEGHPEAEYIYDIPPTDEEVRQYCQELMRKNSTWKAHDNITVEFLDLYDSADPTTVSELNSFTLGDFVNVYYADLGIVSENVEIMSLTYDVLRERIVELQLNDLKTTYGQVLIDSIGGKK